VHANEPTAQPAAPTLREAVDELAGRLIRIAAAATTLRRMRIRPAAEVISSPSR
jgi:hypothetical protein